MENTFLVDSEFETVCTEYEQKMKDIEEQLQKYIEDTQQIISEKDLEGKTAESLQGFSELVVETIKSELESIGVRYNTIVGGFVENVSTVDDTELGGI